MIEELLKTQAHHDPNLRTGQALMNQLFSINRDLYMEIRGTEADCFYQDEKIPKFWEVIYEAAK